MAAHPLNLSDASLEPVAKADFNLRISELECSVHEISQELALLRSRQDTTSGSGDESFPRLLRQLIDMTNRILPGVIRIEHSIDEEYPGTGAVVFHVTPETKLGDSNAVIDKELEWHRKARMIYPEATCHFTLAID